MRAVTCEIAERLWHKCCQKAVLFGDSPHHPFEKCVTISRGESIGIGPVDFELAVRVLVIIRVRIPAKFPHVFQQGGHEIDISVQGSQVLARLGEGIGGIPRQILPFFILLQEHEFRFDADIYDVALLFRQIELTDER